MSIEKDVLHDNTTYGQLNTSINPAISPAGYPVQPPCVCKQWLNDVSWWNAAVSFYCAIHGQVTVDRRTLIAPVPEPIHPLTVPRHPFTVPMYSPPNYGGNQTYPAYGTWISGYTKPKLYGAVAQTGQTPAISQTGQNVGSLQQSGGSGRSVCQADGFDGREPND